MDNEEKVITIQKTSKRLKLNSFLAKGFTVIGLIMIFAGASGDKDNHTILWGCLIALFGAVYLGITRVRIWWNHK